MIKNFLEKLKKHQKTQEQIEKLIQEQINAQVREAYGEKGFQRWCHLLYNGKMKNPDAHASVNGKCGDTMQIFLRFENERVSEASYITDGCGSSNICGSFAAEMAVGKNVDELAAITGEEILAEIGRFPAAEQHCAFLAAETLQEVLHSYMVRTGKQGR